MMDLSKSEKCTTTIIYDYYKDLIDKGSHFIILSKMGGGHSIYLDDKGDTAHEDVSRRMAQ